MSITLSTNARNAAADALLDLLDAGSGTATGLLILETSGNAEVATLGLSNPAFGNAAAGVATAGTIADDTNATGGTVTQFKAVDRDGTTIFSGSVTATGGGGDLEVVNTTIGAGVTVSVSSFTFTQPATEA